MISFGILISSILVKPLFLPSLSFFFFFVFFHLSTVEAFGRFIRLLRRVAFLCYIHACFAYALLYFAIA